MSLSGVGVTDDLSEPCRHCSAFRWQRLGIHTQCEARCCMPKPVRYSFDRFTRGDQICGVGVPQSMHLHPRQLGLFHSFDVEFAHRVGVH